MDDEDNQGSGVNPIEFIGRISTYFAHYKIRTSAYAALSVAEVLFELALVPLCFKILVDEAIPAKDGSTIGWILGILIVGALLYSGLGIIRDYLVAWLGNRILSDIRQRLHSHLQRLPASFYARTPSGDILSRFTTDLGSVDYVMFQAFPFGSRAALGLVASIIVMAALDWRLVICCLLALPLALVGPWLLGGRCAALVEESRQQQSVLVSDIQEIVRNQPAVKIFRMRHALEQRFGHLLEENFRTSCRSHFLLQLMERTPSLGMLAFNLAIIVVGTVLTYQDVMTIGALVAFSRVALDLSKSVETLSWALPDMVRAGIGLGRIDEILSEPTEEPKPQENRPPVTLSEGIHFNAVTFGYDTTQTVMQDVNLTIPKGFHVSFVGESGSGKSTFLNLVSRLYPPRAGQIRFDQTDILPYPMDDTRRPMAAVFQDHLLFRYSARENLLLARPDATQEQIEAACRAAEVHDVIANLPQGYDTPIGDAGGKLSGGQRQRLAIARALLCDPQILLLDEATSALDPATEHSINDMLTRTTAGRTVLSVTHRLQSAQNSDMIVVMRPGGLAEQGRHQELLDRQSTYATLWRKQSGIQVSDDGHQASLTPDKLRDISFLRLATDEQLHEIASVLVTEHMPPGRVVVQQGDMGNRMYFVARGKLDIRIHTAEGDRHLTTLSDGDYFGEISLLREQPRTASAICMTDCTLLSLAREPFDHLLQRNEALRHVVEEEVTRREQALRTNQG